MAFLAVAACASCFSAPGSQPTEAVGQFVGKWELVPLFDRGKPVIRSGHQYEAIRNTFSFRRPNGEVVTIFAGERTDLASTPPVVWPILPPDGPYGEAAESHDACYKTRGTFEWNGHVGRSRPEPYSRAECDQILMEGMIALGVPAWKRAVIFDAVRAFGNSGWGH